MDNKFQEILNYLLQDDNSYIIPSIAVAITVFILSSNKGPQISDQIQNVIIASVIHNCAHLMVNYLKKNMDRKVKNKIETLFEE